MENLVKISRKNLQINGIYKITNIKNNKIYIGSCSSKTFLYERLIHHREDLLKDRHCNKYLQRSFNKYGIENFYYEILEVCDAEKCIIKEQYWIDLLKPHYNLCKEAGSSFGRKCSNETRNKISKANRNWFKTEEGIKLKKKLSKMKKGKKLSKETIKKILKSRVGSKHSEETKLKMRNSALKRYNS